MQTIFNVLLRLVLLAAGLVFAASLLVVALLFLALWVLRASWARVTGQPVVPFVMRVDPRGGFGQVFRGRAGAPTPAATGRAAPAAAAGRERLPDIEDVEPKPPRQ